jgi:hypothetical protein
MADEDDGMYKFKVYTEETVAKVGIESPPMGPGFTPEQLQGATLMEVWGTLASAKGPDRTEFRLFDKEGRLKAVREVKGY